MPVAASPARHRKPDAPVLCLHASLGCAGQWRALGEALAPRHDVLAVDLLGYGSRAAWPRAAPLRLDDELPPLITASRGLDGPAHVVGHSYGGALALRLALQRPDLVRSLVLFEPAYFGLLAAREPNARALAEIRGYADTVALLVGHGAPAAAGRCFVDYWCGRGHWDSLDTARQALLCQGMPKVAAEWGAIFAESPNVSALRRLGVPTQLVCGIDTNAPAQAVVRQLAALLPRATARFLPGVAHMGPVTHPQRVNRLIARLLSQDSPLAAAA